MAAIKVLHTFSNHKWTGPAEPAVNLALGLKKRGLEVMFAPGRDEDGGSKVAMRCAARDLRCVGDMHLSKHRNSRRNADDAWKLAETIDREKFDIVHAHMDNDHRIALAAFKRCEHRPLLIRSIYDGLPPVRPPGRADALIVLSKKVGQWLRKKRRRRYRHVFLLDGAVDLDRFAPQPRSSAVARELRIGPKDIVVGIVARMQTHRRFHVLLEAFARASISVPELKLLIVGRGTNADKVARKPVKEMRIEDRVIFSGYRREDFVAVVNCFDFKVFLVPGSDGTCRAVREVMALGRPIIAADRGMLSEIVDDEVCGMVIRDSVENLRAAIVRLARDRRLRLRMGRAAADKAAEFFDIERQSREAFEIYKSMLKQAK